MSGIVSVQLDAVAALAAELSGLAAVLREDADTCRAVAQRVTTALPGDEGWRAAAAVRAWSTLLGTLADRTAAIAGTLAAAVVAYRAADAGLSERLGASRLGRAAPR